MVPILSAQTICEQPDAETAMHQNFHMSGAAIG